MLRGGTGSGRYERPPWVGSGRWGFGRPILLYASSMSKRSPVPPASSQRRIANLPPGWQTVSHTVLADGTLAVISADVDLASEHRRIQAALQASSPLKPPSQLRELGASGTARIWTLAATGWMEGPTFPLETPFPIVDRFADGRWLVVGARILDGANARVLGPDGCVIARFILGDGIEYVAIDQSNRIWVAWFDEGVFGNDGWRVPGKKSPPSSSVVACFADDGALLELPGWPSEAGSVADCYAMNVVGRGAWSCTYLDFPLVYRVPGEPVRWWKSGVDGPSAIAIDGSHALLAGGYSLDANRLALVSLSGVGAGEDAHEIASWNLPLRPRTPDNEWAPAYEHPTLLVGRGDTIHLIDNNLWSTWRIADLTPPSQML